MNANELMLGNYIEFNETIYKVLAIKSGFMQVAYISAKGNFIVSWVDKDSLNPIPLTEKWLLDFGFEVEDMADLGKLIYTPISEISDLCLSWNNGSIWLQEHDTGIKQVHQLQNLYFSLTGTHLQLVSPK